MTAAVCNSRFSTGGRRSIRAARMAWTVSGIMEVGCSAAFPDGPCQLLEEGVAKLRCREWPAPTDQCRAPRAIRTVPLCGCLWATAEAGPVVLHRICRVGDNPGGRSSPTGA